MFEKFSTLRSLVNELAGAFEIETKPKEELPVVEKKARKPRSDKGLKRKAYKSNGNKRKARSDKGVSRKPYSRKKSNKPTYEVNESGAWITARKAQEQTQKNWNGWLRYESLKDRSMVLARPGTWRIKSPGEQRTSA